jgi:hypothetical protein
MGQREGVCNVMGSQSKASRKEWQEIVSTFLEDDVLVKAMPPCGGVHKKTRVNVDIQFGFFLPT